jgi:SPP1 family predicted phage head-tail adaptor
MRSGSLDRRVELQHRNLAARNTQGEQVESFTTFATVWAKKTDLRGREYFAAQEMQAEASAKFEMRWRDDLLATDRILFNGVAYNVRNIAELGRREGLEVTVSAAVS